MSEARKCRQIQPGYINGKSTKPNFCIDCDKEITTGSVLGRCRGCYYIFSKGKNHPNYIEGLIREYPLKFKYIRELIRIRDNHQCQICGKTTKQNGRRLDVHHVDYDKDNLNSENLISLCHKCHMKTNYNREIYIEFFKILINILK